MSVIISFRWLSDQHQFEWRTESLLRSKLYPHMSFYMPWTTKPWKNGERSTIWEHYHTLFWKGK